LQIYLAEEKLKEIYTIFKNYYSKMAFIYSLHEPERSDSIKTNNTSISRKMIITKAYICT